VNFYYSIIAVGLSQRQYNHHSDLGFSPIY
jgi:hypothetical protein